MNQSNSEHDTSTKQPPGASQTSAYLKILLGVVVVLALGLAWYLVEQGASRALSSREANSVATEPRDPQTAYVAAFTPLELSSENLQTLGQSGWQCVASFPSATPWDNLGMNDSVSFKFYADQGYLWLRVADGVESFRLYVNNHQLDVSKLQTPGLYQLDISGITVDGENNLVVAPVLPRDLREAVTVYIPYPEVLDWTIVENYADRIDKLPEEVAGFQPQSFSLVEQIIEAEVANGYPGAQLAVVKGGKLIYENAWGVKNTAAELGAGDSQASASQVAAKSGSESANGSENAADAVTSPQSNHDNQVTRTTLYDLGGLTSVVATAYAVQHLVDQGKLNLDDTVASLLGDEFASQTILINYNDEDYESPTIATEQAWKRALTVRQLLMHQSGFPVGPKYYLSHYDAESQGLNFTVPNLLYAGVADNSTSGTGNAIDTSDKDVTTRTDSAQAKITPADTWHQICRTPLVRQPGTKTVVSDLDALLLGLIVEKVSGQSLDAYCREQIWQPLGLNITFNPSESASIADDSSNTANSSSSEPADATASEPSSVAASNSSISQQLNVAATELSGNTREGTVTFPGVRTGVVQGEVHDEMSYYCMNGVAGHAGAFASATDLARLGAVMLTGGSGLNKFFTQSTISQFTSANESDGCYGLLWRRQGADSGYAFYFGTQAPESAFGCISWTGCLLLIDPVNDLVVAYTSNPINTHLVDKTVDANSFNGNWYLASSRGFIPQILYQGLTPASSASIDRASSDASISRIATTSEYLKAQRATVQNLLPSALRLIREEFEPKFGYAAGASEKVTEELAPWRNYHALEQVVNQHS